LPLERNVRIGAKNVLLKSNLIYLLSSCQGMTMGGANRLPLVLNTLHKNGRVRKLSVAL